MLPDVIEKEISNYFKSPRFVLSFLVSIFLIFLSIIIGSVDYKSEKAEFESASTLHREYLETVEDYNRLGFGGFDVDRPPAPLSVIVDGIESVSGRSAHISSVVLPEISANSKSSNPLLSLYGAFDLTFVVAVMLSLLAIMISFDAICGEKERGTLRLQLANALPRDTLILGKMIGGISCLLVPILISMIGSILLLAADPSIRLQANDYVRLLGVFFAYSLYVTLFFGIGLFVSSLTHRSSSALLALLLIWIASVSVLPRVGVMAARQVAPAMTISQLDARKKAISLDEQQQLREKIREARREFDYDRNDESEEANEQRQLFQEAMSDHFSDYRTNLKKRHGEVDVKFMRENLYQQKLSSWLSKLSPTAVLYSASMGLADTGPALQERFKKSLANYSIEFSDFIGPLMGPHGRRMARSSSDEPEEPGIDVEAIPKFNFKKTVSPSEAFGGAAFDLALLAGLIVIMFLAAYAAFLRYDVR